jgi:hypothetical protein
MFWRNFCLCLCTRLHDSIVQKTTLWLFTAKNTSNLLFLDGILFSVMLYLFTRWLIIISCRTKIYTVSVLDTAPVKWISALCVGPTCREERPTLHFESALQLTGMGLLKICPLLPRVRRDSRVTPYESQSKISADIDYFLHSCYYYSFLSLHTDTDSVFFYLSVRIMTRVRAGRPRSRSSIHGRGKSFSFSQ